MADIDPDMADIDPDMDDITPDIDGIEPDIDSMLAVLATTMPALLPLDGGAILVDEAVFREAAQLACEGRVTPALVSIKLAETGKGLGTKKQLTPRKAGQRIG